MDIDNTLQNNFELVSKNVKDIANLGTARHTKKPIYWRNSNGFITAYQLGGARITMRVLPTKIHDQEYNELVGFTHDGKPKQSFDLLATILAHYGNYIKLGSI